ncbi:hypothetical protein ACNFJ7_02170 [Sphingomonas sp. HT-1]|uniref:hypothetical protein n=1 Tax=unclassified Sphingomonas TaxID=196159 RepID=UPI0002E527D4|nr:MULTISPECIES: hypothetical protein [unclassified Sphingomonas]KTF68674.1 hypothetical protein ATB93_13195 [Sphingomonas sp. WG]
MLIATKPFTYATRRLKAGDTFEPRTRAHERLLIALKRAQRSAGENQPDEQQDPAPQAPAPKGDDLASLRKAYEVKFGKRPYHGWDAATLTEKIGAA